MRVIITGAGGFIGRVLVEVLHERGHDVIAVQRSGFDLTNGDAVRAWCEGCTQGRTDSIDAVLHLAAQSEVRASFIDPAWTWATNVGGTANLISGLCFNGERPRVVFASTNAVYGPGYVGALSEDLDPHPSSPYAASKLAAEELLREQSAAKRCGVTVLRLFNVAGGAHGVVDPNTTRIIGAALRTARSERDTVRINGDGSAVRDFVHVLDVADAFERAMETTELNTFRVLNVGTGAGTSMLEVVESARRITGRSIPVVFGPAADEPQVLVADTARVTAELGWKPRLSTIERIVADGWRARDALD